MASREKKLKLTPEGRCGFLNAYLRLHFESRWVVSKSIHPLCILVLSSSFSRTIQEPPVSCLVVRNLHGQMLIAVSNKYNPEGGDRNVVRAAKCVSVSCGFWLLSFLRPREFVLQLSSKTKWFGQNKLASDELVQYKNMFCRFAKKALILQNDELLWTGSLVGKINTDKEIDCLIIDSSFFSRAAKERILAKKCIVKRVENFEQLERSMHHPIGHLVLQISEHYNAANNAIINEMARLPNVPNKVELCVNGENARILNCTRHLLQAYSGSNILITARALLARIPEEDRDDVNDFLLEQINGFWQNVDLMFELVGQNQRLNFNFEFCIARVIIQRANNWDTEVANSYSDMDAVVALDSVGSPYVKWSTTMGNELSGLTAEFTVKIE